MATAAELNATSSIVNGQGLAANAVVISQINTFQAQPTFTLLTTIYANANTNANVANVVIPILNTLGNTATKGFFLLDLYPPNISPTSSGTVGKRFGGLSSASETIKTQAQLPFVNGMAGFANVFSFAHGFAVSNFDNAASVHILKNKTYAQSGLGYQGITDLITGGIGTPGALLAQTVTGWGTMYDITKVNLINDPYVFGENLLNQGLGSYGDLETKLSATGLDIEDITKVPGTQTTTTQETSVMTSQSLVGEVELPTVANITVTNTVTGNSPNVLLSVYKTITGTDLKAIINATGFNTVGTNIETLADLLDFKKAINANLLPQLQALGVQNFADLAAYLNNRVGQGNFTSWSSMSVFLSNVSAPALNYTTTTANTQVLLPSTITTMQNLTGTGSGPFGNPVIIDFLGASSGTPYTTHWPTLNTYYSTLVPTVYSALQALNSAVINTNNIYTSTIVPETSPGAGDGSDGIIDASGVVANVALVNTAMSTITNPNLAACERAYYIMLDRLGTEVSNLIKAGVVFASASSQLLPGFGRRMGSLGSPDPMLLGSDLYFANIITNNTAGDTIRAVVAETRNTATLGKNGIQIKNDPNPMAAIGQSQNQNISLTAYLSTNK